MDTTELVGLVQTVAQKVDLLVKKIIDREFPISYLTIFSHNPSQYYNFVEIAKTLGTHEETDNGIKFILKDPIQTAVGDISLIRIRKPDPYRPQLGCADLVADYNEIKESYLLEHSENLRIAPHPTLEMIEFFDLGTNDVLAYVIHA